MQSRCCMFSLNVQAPIWSQQTLCSDFGVTIAICPTSVCLEGAAAGRTENFKMPFCAEVPEPSTYRLPVFCFDLVGASKPLHDHLFVARKSSATTGEQTSEQTRVSCLYPLCGAGSVCVMDKPRRQGFHARNTHPGNGCDSQAHEKTFQISPWFPRERTCSSWA